MLALTCLPEIAVRLLSQKQKDHFGYTLDDAVNYLTLKQLSLLFSSL